MIRDCKAQTSLAEVILGGTFDLRKKPAQMELTAAITGLAVEDLVPKLLPESLNAAGKLKVALPENMEVHLAASGPVDKPDLCKAADTSRGDRFAPQKKLPAATGPDAGRFSSE